MGDYRPRTGTERKVQTFTIKRKSNAVKVPYINQRRHLKSRSDITQTFDFVKLTSISPKRTKPAPEEAKDYSHNLDS